MADPEIQQIACPCTGEEFKLLAMSGGDLIAYCTRCKRMGAKFTIAGGSVEAALQGGETPPEITRIEYLDHDQLATEGVVAEAPREQWPRPLPDEKQMEARRKGVAVRFEGGPWHGRTQRFPADVENFYIGSSGLGAALDSSSSSAWGSDVPGTVKAGPRYVEGMVEQDGTKVFTWADRHGETLIDPDCAGTPPKCGSCVGGPCQHHCHTGSAPGG